MIRLMFTHIYVSRSPHYAVHNLTGYSPGRASPDARRTPPRTVWLSARVPYITAVCRRPKSHGDCGLPVLLTLQRVPYRPCVSHREPRHTDRPRRSALSGGVDDCLDALAHAIAGALLKVAPRTYGWCRTRWSCATLAATLQAKHGIAVSAETVRRWLHEIGWVWKRAKLVAKDDDPHRIERLARIRFHVETLQAHEVMVFADELDIHLLPKVGAAWMPQGT